MFAAWIGADTEQILELLRTHLDGAARLGRSRSAEFGRCTLSVLEEKRIPVSTAATENMAVVYCVSDLALQDELGFPTRQPLAGDFGLPDGTIDWTRSHIRTRRFSPFNAALRTYETERIVIEKGSVIVFDCHGHRIEGTECQIGLYQSAGMGRVIVNPRFLLTPDFRAVEGQTLSPALQPGIKAQVLDRIPASAHFVAMIRQRTSGSVGAVEWADRFRDSLTKLYRTARGISGAAPGTPVGPSKAQWGRLDGLARDAGTKKDFLRNVSGNNILGRTAKDGSGREIFRPDEAWGSLGELDGGFVSFADWFRKCMAGELANLSAPEGMDQVRAFVRMAQSVSGAEHRGVPRRQEQNA
jgi:CRISPR-associated protein Csx10